MINLIPNEEKKIMVEGFYYRIAATFFMALGMTMVILFSILLPSYILSVEKKNFINDKLILQTTEPVSSDDKEVTMFINTLDQKLSLFEKTEKNKFLFSERVINEILSRKLSNVKISQISYVNNKDAGTMSVNISGTAPNRETLLSFRRALEESAFFKNVDLPISNFVKGSNIKFSLNLTPSI